MREQRKKIGNCVFSNHLAKKGGISYLLSEGRAMKILRILLIEDDLDHQVILREVLEDIDNYAIKLSTASSGAEGLKKMRKGDFDLVITDYHMPEMSGLDLLRVTTEENIDVPIIIIMITGLGDEKVAVQAMKMGAWDYVPKDTITTDSLNVVISRVLEKHEAKKERERLETALAKDQGTGEG